MGIVHLSEPPPFDYRPCVLCLSAAKQAQWETFSEMIEGSLKADDDTVTWVPWLASPPLIREGNWRAVPGDAPQLGVIDGLCWDHVAGFGRPKLRAPLLDGAGLPPGLLKGRR